MVHNLSILGSTGSIGTQTLDVVDKLGLKVVALAAYRNTDRSLPPFTTNSARSSCAIT